MNDETERKCPYCGHEKYRLVEDIKTFEGWTYKKQCLKCGRTYN